MSDAPAAPVTENGVPPVAQDQVEEAPGFKVFAGNLAYSTTDEGLKAFFAPVESDIISAQVIMRGNRSAGYGFVALTCAEAAQKAVEALDKQELDGRPIIVEVAKPAEEKDKERKEKKPRARRPGRRGAKAVTGEVTEAEANGETIEAEAGKADDAPATGDADKPKKKKKKTTKKPRSTAEGETTDAAATEGEAKPPRKKRVPRPPRPAGEQPVGDLSKTVLFVANLGFNIDDAGLAALFTDVGIKVNSARIVRRRWGKPRKSKGYGFVDVGDEEEQTKAIAALEGKEVGGRQIAVKIAVDAQTNEEKEEGSADPVTESTAEQADEEATPEATIVAS